jgi:uncharacterized secreted protein with C-terminal beta-propeller domain
MKGEETMKKMMQFLSVVVLVMGFCTSVYAAAEPVISVNGMTGDINLKADAPITINLKLSPGEKKGADADWWLLYYAFGKWHCYKSDGKWAEVSDIASLSPAYQGKLFEIPATDILNLPQLPIGKYTLVFGVDFNMNGKLDKDSLVFKAVNLAVSESGKRSDFTTAGSANYAGYDGSLLLSPMAAPTKTDQTAEVARAIEEADIIKVEGNYLYLLNQYKGLTICDVSKPDAPFIAGRAAVTGQPIDMYIKDSRAYIIVSGTYQTVYKLVADGSTTSSTEQTSRIQVADISDKTNPKLTKSFDLKGKVTDSRIVGNILYVVSSEEQYYYYAQTTTLKVDGTTSSQNTQNVYVASIDISDPDNIREADRKDFGGTARYIHVTDQAIFIASGVEYYGESSTTITYLDISDPAGKMVKRGAINVPGSVNDKFKMDYYNGYFRVCTYQWSLSWSRPGISSLFVIDTKNPDLLKQVGSVKLGEGEQLFATRFDGNRAYMVTYKMKDPLWVIDLSDPANPAVKGELVVPGWSTYIEPKGDRLIALGVDDTNGWNVSVSLFDVSKPESPSLIKRVSFGDKDSGWSSSTAYNDVKAFTVLDELGLILLPYTTSDYTSGTYKTDNRLQLIDYSTTNLNTRGWVSQKGSVLRSRSVSNRLFSVSNDELQVIDATNRDQPKVTAKLTLAINITDFVVLQNGYGVQVTESDGKYTLRAVPLSDPENGQAASETTLDNTSYSGAFVNGNLMYVVSNVYDYGTSQALIYRPYGYGKTNIQVIDFSKPEAPVKRGKIEVDGSYYMSLNNTVSIYPYYSSGQILQMNGNKLIFPYSAGYYGPVYTLSADSATVTKSEETTKAQSGVKVIDLSDADNPKLLSELSLDITSGSGYFLNGTMLYFSYGTDLGYDEKKRPQSKYYLGRIDLSNLSKPLQLASINIPGTCIGTDKTGAYAFTVNTLWGEDWSQSYTFNSVKLTDDKALLMEEVKLGSYVSSSFISDGIVYLSGNGITPIDISNPEKLAVYDTSLKDAWASVLSVKNRKIFAGVSGGMACYNASNPAKLTLDEFTDHYGYNSRIAFSSDKAYLPMGYYGVWVKSLNN